MLVSVASAAQRLGLKEITIRKKMARREIAVVKLGRAVRIPESELERLISQNTIPARQGRQ